MENNSYAENGQNFEEASEIEGFDIELNEEHKSRIDRLVDNYEKIILSDINKEYTRTSRLSDRIADKIAAFGGSWTFIIIFAVFLISWILWNSLSFYIHRFDPYPFILLNLCLSFIAAFQAPIIMMSQNRQTLRDRHESVIDFAINYKAEQEIDDMQIHLHRIEADMKEIKKLLLAANINKDEVKSKQ